MPALWFRNTWSWGRDGEDYWGKPKLSQVSQSEIRAEHESLGKYALRLEPALDGHLPELLFTENATNTMRLWGADSGERYVQDAFHRYVINRERGAVNPEKAGTKAAAYYSVRIPAGGEIRVRFRLTAAAETREEPFGANFDQLFRQRKLEADEFYADTFRWAEELAPERTHSTSNGNDADRRAHASSTFSTEERNVTRQAMAGLVWSCQFYHYIVDDWLEGDSTTPPPPRERLQGRNHDWRHLYTAATLCQCPTCGISPEVPISGSGTAAKFRGLWNGYRTWLICD